MPQIAPTHNDGSFAPIAPFVRSACRACGTHSNTARDTRLGGICPNCGSFDLSVVAGAAPIAHGSLGV